MKPLLQFPLDSPHPPHPHHPHHPASGLFHSFHTMDPLQKAMMSHTFGPLLRTKRPVISCNICQIRFNSESQAEAHYKGNRHARRVKGIETKSSQNPNPEWRAASPDSDRHDDSQCSPSSTPPFSPSDSDLPASPPSPALAVTPVDPSTALASSSAESEEEKTKKLLYCTLCKVAVNSLSQLEAHNKGTKHKTILEARRGQGPIKAYPRLCPWTGPDHDLGSDPNSQERTFHCEICNVRVNSEMQLKQHISSRRHRDGVAGKPNPLLNRHKKPTDFMEVPTSLGLLPPPLAMAAAMASLSPATHHHLLQGAPLSLLRPAPGPIRNTHGPILFSPY
uniref:C2H2-type domain-containing protein n=1 Tax=Knipowitschia caucasica TaxID=637954 RepID=A0AAV2M6M1_KNICA